jgi:NitT/TauT family transport system substrate-binding protein
MKFLRVRMQCIVLAAAVLIVSFIFIACSGKSGASKSAFKVAIVTWPGDAPPYLANAKGFFGDLKVEVSILDDASQRRAAFKSGDVQVIAETIDSFASGAPAGIAGKAIIKVDDSFGGDGIVSKKEIGTINQLKGKTVAYPEGMPSHFFLLSLLRMAGMTQADIVAKPMGDPGKAGQAFISGSVDAAVTWEPFLTQAAQQTFGHRLMDTRDAKGLITDIMVVSNDAIAKRPKDVQTFIDGWFQAIEYRKAHEKEADEIMAKGLGLPVADFTGMVSGLKYADFPENKRFLGTEAGQTNQFLDVFDSASSIWKAINLIKTSEPASKFVDNTFVANYKPAAPVIAENPVPVPPSEGVEKLILQVPPIYFETGSSHIRSVSYATLDKVASDLKYFPTSYIRVEGYTDDVGDAGPNQKLSEGRADEVAKYLVEKLRISQDQLKPKGFGKSALLKKLSGESVEDWRERNRRTEFKVTN